MRKRTINDLILMEMHAGSTIGKHIMTLSSKDLLYYLTDVFGLPVQDVSRMPLDDRRIALYQNAMASGCKLEGGVLKVL